MDFYVHLVGLVSFIWQFRLKCQSQINQNDASIRTAEKDEEIAKKAKPLLVTMQLL